MLDIVSDLTPRFPPFLNVDSNGESLSPIIDTADQEPGVMFSFARTATTNGDKVIEILESDTEADEDFTPVSPESLIGTTEGIGDSPAFVGVPLPGVGVFSNKRYLRARLTVSNGSEEVGDVTSFLVFVITKAEILPNV